MAVTGNFKGTSQDKFKVGKQGAQLKKSSATRMSVRDNADGVLANMEGADPLLPQDFLTKAFFDANNGGGGAPSNLVAGKHPALDSWGCWDGKSKLGSNDAFWIRIWLPEGTYDRIETAVVGGAGAGKNVDMGVYADSGGAPSGSPLQSTGAQDTAGANNTFFLKAFSGAGTLVVPSGGSVYWAAILSTDSTIEFASTHHEHEQVWHDRLWREKTSYGASLAAVPGSFNAAVKSAILYIAIVEQ